MNNESLNSLITRVKTLQQSLEELHDYLDDLDMADPATAKILETPNGPDGDTLADVGYHALEQLQIAIGILDELANDTSDTDQSLLKQILPLLTSFETSTL